MNRLIFVAAIVLTAVLGPACGGGGGGGAPAPPAVLTITTTALPAGTVGTAYTFNLTAANGTVPYIWAITTGSLPQGLIMDAAGVISGTPEAPGNVTFTARVADSATPQATAERILNILINAPPLVIITTSLAAGNLTVPYTQQLQATGGVQPYAWTSTALPLGLALSASGLITGTPTAVGATPVTFTVTDSATTTGTSTISITINGPPPVTVSGNWTFHKVPVNAAGLNLAGIFQSPARVCFVGLEDQAAPGSFYSATFTDILGNYSFPSPQNTTVKLFIFALHASASGSIKVVDRDSTASPKTTWAIATPNIAVGTVNVTGSNWNVPDSTRTNGAFNIVDVVYGIQQTILGLDPASNFGDATIEFSPSFTDFSYFQGSTGYIDGDRTTETDDFDDAVIAHEYSHYLQTRFSRTDSPGGPHSVGQILDPRVAHSEGQATFMGQMFVANPLYIDTSSAGASVTDLESGAVVNQGYWNEDSVMKVLWDCFDSTNEAGDTLALPFSAFWAVFTQDMQNHTFTYLIDFMDSLVARNPANGGQIASILGLETIMYTPGGNPSVPIPWPYLLQSGVPIPFVVDSSVNNQWNLLASTDVLYFIIPAGQSVTINLTHTGEGPSPAATDYVDFYVFNDTGHAYSPGGELFAATYAPVTGPGYTHGTTFTLVSGGTYGVVATSCFKYPASAAPPPTFFSSANYQITAIY